MSEKFTLSTKPAFYSHICVLPQYTEALNITYMRLALNRDMF